MLRIALTSFPDEEAAANLAREIVEERLAACATILPRARSIYRWEGATQDSQEVLVLFKLAASTYPDFARKLLAGHPYETPELLSWDAGSAPDYLAWALDQCHKTSLGPV